MDSCCTGSAHNRRPVSLFSPSFATLPFLFAFHGDGDDNTRQEGQSADYHNRPNETKSVGDEAGGKRANGIAHIAPEAVDAERTSAPSWMRSIGDGSDQSRIDHGRTDSKKKACNEPPHKALHGRRQK